MAEVCLEVVHVTTTGSAGSATGTGYSGTINGYITSIYVDFNASAPAGTTDTTISYATRGGNIWAITDSATDVMVHPRASLVTNANGAITNSHGYFYISDRVKVVLAQCDALTDAAVVYIWYVRI